MRAWVSLRNALHYRREAFQSGLEACGYEVHFTLTEHPGPRDVLLIWNRYGQNDRVAQVFERKGLPVLVAENALWGNDFCGDRWYSLSYNVHNTGRFPVGGPERWDALNATPIEWRTGPETLILPQRGIGPEGVAMPHGWAQKVQKETGGRIRPHPGTNTCRSLQEDLECAGKVITWGSGAAIKALLWGVPVRSDLTGWVGEQDNTDAGRLAMFRKLAWGQWRLSEISSGEAFRRYL